MLISHICNEGSLILELNGGGSVLRVCPVDGCSSPVPTLGTGAADLIWSCDEWLFLGLLADSSEVWTNGAKLVA